MRRRKHPAASGREAPRPDAAVSVEDTGDAEARGGSMAVSGYGGPPPGDHGTAPSVWLHRTGDATAIGGAFANSGYIGKLVLPPREPAPWPHQVGVLPPRARWFQRRAEAVAGAAAPCRILTGMGGAGKTQLAADHAHAAWESGDLDVLVWIGAATRSAVVAGFAQAGVELCRADPGDPEQAARAFLAWLRPRAGGRSCRWLVVLDDITDPGDMRGLWPRPTRTASPWPRPAAGRRPWPDPAGRW